MRTIALILGLIVSLLASASISIEECVEKAEANYPLIKKYRLLEATMDIDLAEINTSWLPRIGISGQTTVQNIVPSFPKSLTGVLDQMGQPMKGLGKFQYKISTDVSQTIWDGGSASARRDVARAQKGVMQASLDVELYTVRQRVESVYFAILLTEQQIARNEMSYNLLCRNLEKLRAMLKNGTAMQTDLDMVEAQSLTVSQEIIQAKSAAEGYRHILELFTGEALNGKKLIKPDPEIPLNRECNRPELRLFEHRSAANDAASRLTDTSLMPSIGFFAQAYYGYPGFDYFKSMTNRELSFNILAGIKVTWKIDSFYSKKNNGKRTSVNSRDITADKELFLFNNAILSASQTETINGLRKVIKDDSRIVILRENVRKAAESQLENGIIDTTALLSKITEENLARLTADFHEIQLIKEIYNLKYTLNR